MDKLLFNLIFLGLLNGFLALSIWFSIVSIIFQKWFLHCSAILLFSFIISSPTFSAFLIWPLVFLMFVTFLIPSHVLVLQIVYCIAFICLLLMFYLICFYTIYIYIIIYIINYARYTMLKNHLLWFTLGRMTVTGITI